MTYFNFSEGEFFRVFDTLQYTATELCHQQ